MKIVIHNGAREWRGNEKQTTVLAQELIARGHSVVVSCHPRGQLRDILVRLGVPTTTRRPAGDLDLWSLLRFAAWLRRERPDALLLTTWKRVPTGAWAARQAGVGRVVVRLGLARPIPPARRFHLAFRRYVDALIVNSTEVRDRWLASAPWFPEGAVHVVLNGVAPAPPPDASPDLRSALGAGPLDRVVLAVGGLERRKGFDLLLRAFASAPGDAHLWIAGEGPMEAELRTLAGSLGVQARVRWLGQRSDVPALLGASDVFVLSSRNEGMAVVMLEAMAAGVPVIATDVSGVGDALAARGGRPSAGWIVPPEDASALGVALCSVLSALDSDPETVNRARAEARWRAAHWFSVDAMMAGVEAALLPLPPTERSR